MTRPSACFLALAAAFTAAPSIAQHTGEPTPALESWEGEWRGDWEDETTYRGMWRGSYTDADGRTVEGEYRGTFIGQSRFQSDEGHELHREGPRGWREGRGPRADMQRRPLPLPPQPQIAWTGPRFGYSLEERAAWLDECRVRIGYYRYEDWRGERRVRHSTPGSFDECAAYLDRYEASASAYPTIGYGYAGPVMMVRVPIHRERSRDCDCTSEVIEEIVEEAPAPRPARRAAPRPAPSKRVRITR